MLVGRRVQRGPIAEHHAVDQLQQHGGDKSLGVAADPEMLSAAIPRPLEMSVLT